MSQPDEAIDQVHDSLAAEQDLEEPKRDDEDDEGEEDSAERLAPIDKQKNWNDGFLEEDGVATAIAHPEMAASSEDEAAGERNESDDSDGGDVDPYDEHNEGVPPASMAKKTKVVDTPRSKRSRRKEKKKSKRKQLGAAKRPMQQPKKKLKSATSSKDFDSSALF